MADETKLTIPAPPWTVENLGEQVYGDLARAFGIFDPRNEPAGYRPPLDLVAQYATQQGKDGD
ncbi:MAG: hypothetical protein ACO24O_06705 [Arenimonas sp.]